MSVRLPCGAASSPRQHLLDRVGGRVHLLGGDAGPEGEAHRGLGDLGGDAEGGQHVGGFVAAGGAGGAGGGHDPALLEIQQDRKSTRLNSSHVAISYAVFCLKKKKRRTTQ